MLTIQKDKYTFAQLVNNIEQMYLGNPVPQNNWYAEAWQFCQATGTKYLTSPVTITGILSALSPLKEWEENKRMVIKFMNGQRNLHFRSVVEKCERILLCSNPAEIITILSGLKTVNFFKNICGSYRDVTVDRHVISTATGYEYRISLTIKQYGIIADAVRQVADKYRVLPRTMQATIWTNYREQFNAKLYEDVPF